SQVSAYRLDLLAKVEAEIPQTWDEVIALGQRLKGMGRASVSTPLMPIDCFPTFFSLCANFGEQAFTSEEFSVSRSLGQHVLGMMRMLVEIGQPAALYWNPPQILDQMSTSNEIIYT